ncbi:MAG TPA: DUF2911 domain-containing protein [Terriglobales bacterium]
MIKPWITPVVFIPFLLLTVMAVGQESPSNRNQAEFRFADGKRVKVDYGKPSTAPAFGGAVPYGKIWGPGFGRATSLTTDVPIQIDEVVVPPGVYSIYMLPSEGDWTLILSQKAGQSAASYPQGWDFARIKMKKRSLSEPVGQLTILFSSHGPGGGAMKIRLGGTELWVNFEEQLNANQGEGDAS